jgi:hypothetical protein
LSSQTKSPHQLDIWGLLIDVLAHERALQTYIDDYEKKIFVGISYLYRSICSQRFFLELEGNNIEEAHRERYSKNPQIVFNLLVARGLRSLLANGLQKGGGKAAIPRIRVETGQIITRNTDININLKNNEKYEIYLSALIDIYIPVLKEAVLLKPVTSLKNLPRETDLNEAALTEWIAQGANKEKLDIRKIRLLYYNYVERNFREYIIKHIKPDENAIKEAIQDLLDNKRIFACSKNLI